MSADESPRVYTLPVLRLTKVSDQPGRNSLPVNHLCNGQQVKYWRQQDTPQAARWKTFPKFPLVLDGQGRPWAPACLYLLDRAQANPMQVSSVASLAQSLKDYKGFLDDLVLEWDDFSAVDKYCRPTYLYRTHLQGQVSTGEIKRTTAARRMSSVVGFYRFLLKTPRMRFEPLNAPWVETKYGFRFKDDRGLHRVGQVTTTDLAIRTGSRSDAWDETIADGGKLRPLATQEQECLIQALQALGNTEYSLMHFVALLTGAREQTVLTLRAKDFMARPSEVTQWPFKLRCGPGTGIDTKRDITGVYLSVPAGLYRMLHTYVRSERALARRARAKPDALDYLFLTNRGCPYYESKDDRHAQILAGTSMRRSSPTGQNLREFIAKRVVPEVRKTLPKFSYRFHDMRATFGMNWVDYVLEQDGSKEKYVWARDQLRKLMWHKQATTTDRYLEYRQHMHHLKVAQEGWNQHLLNLIAH